MGMARDRCQRRKVQVIVCSTALLAGEGSLPASASLIPPPECGSIRRCDEHGPYAACDSRIGHSSYLTKLIGVIGSWMIAGVALVLGGCIPIPVWQSRPLPEVVSHLPAELLLDPREALVLIQSVYKDESNTIFSLLDKQAPVASISSIKARFLKGSELAALNREIHMYSMSGVAIVTGGGFPLTLFATTEDLEKLCILAPDGIVVTFTARQGADVKSQIQRVPLHANRRDAILAALRTGGKKPFDKVDGPCGITGEVAWTPQAHEQIIGYFAALPRIETEAANPRLAEILGRAKATAAETGPGSGMLWAVVRRRERALTELPLYLSALDFQELKRTTAATSAREVVMLLPAYLPGRYALENLSVEQLCMIGSNGEILAWRKSANTSARVDISALAIIWLREAHARLAGNSGTPDWDNVCMPGVPQNRSDAEFEGLKAFINARASVMSLRENRPHVTQLLRESLTPIHADTDPAGAGGLFLVVTFEAGHPPIVPLFVRSGHDLVAFVEALRAAEPASVRPILSEISSGGLPTVLAHVCVIGANGQFFELSAQEWLSRTGVIPELVTDSFRREAVSALRGDRQGYMGSYVCSLERARWPEEIRNKVTTFLQRVTVSEENMQKFRQ
jgi:hypothetical protein